MPARDLADANEIWLGDTYFPTKGPVRVTNITVPPNPVVFGDTEKTTDTQVMSQFIQSHTLAGSGMYRGNVRTDFDRHWKSRAETRWRYITLPPEVQDFGRPDAAAPSVGVTSIAYFKGSIYISFGLDVFKWDLSAPGWDVAPEYTLPFEPTDVTTFVNLLVYACTTKIVTFDGATTWTVVNEPASYLAIYDGKAWKLDLTSSVWTVSSSPDGTVWTVVASFLDDCTPTGLVLFRDAAGNQQLYAVTDKALYILDQTAKEWFITDVRYSQYENAGRHSVVFRDGKLYIKTGGVSVISVDIGTTTVVSSLGLDRDDGVPPEDYGEITCLAADYNWLYALIDAGAATGDVDDTLSGLDFPMVSGSWSEVLGTHTVRAWNGGWHCTWESPSNSYAATHIVSFVGPDKQLRTLWGANRRLYGTEMPFGIYNARQNPNWPYAPGPVSFISPWWELGSEVQQKLVAHIPVFVTGASETESVDVYIGKDLSPEWQYLERITTPGLNVIKLNDGRGDSARLWRVRFDLRRGSDSSKAPLIEFWALEHMRLLPATYGFVFETNFTTDHKGKTPNQLVSDLKRLADSRQTPQLVEFTYKDDLSGEPQTFLGRISRMQGTEFTGRELRGEGSYLVSVIAPYTEDTL